MGGAYGGGASFCEPPLDARQKENNKNTPTLYSTLYKFHY
jgi:hypothetical protein